MWETKAHDLFCCCFSPVKIIFDSLRIFLRNKQVFSCIFILVTIPLSYLILSLSLSTYPLRSEIYHLEAVALLAPTRFEARHVWKESREDALSLLRLKALFSLPCFLLSLIAAIAAVHSTVFSYNGKVPTLRSAATAFKHNWRRPSITTIFIYAILLAFAPLPRTFAALTPSPQFRLLVLAIGSGIEIYLMAVLSVGLVVSIAEDRFGWEAIKVGSGLMQGRRFCGWVLSGLFVLVSGMIRWKMEVLMEGQISSSGLLSSSAAATKAKTIGMKDKAGIVSLYGIAVLWSYVVTSMFYCESRRRHGIREAEAGGEDEGISML